MGQIGWLLWLWGSCLLNFAHTFIVKWQKSHRQRVNYLNKNGENQDLGSHFNVTVVAVWSVRADNGAVLVIGKVRILLGVVGCGSVSWGGRRLWGLGVVRPAKEAGAAGEAASTAGAATREGPSTTTLGLWAWGLLCRVQPRCWIKQMVKQVKSTRFWLKRLLLKNE